ncbi:MAG: hypothetical protein ACYTG5_12610, partial [Planctomycetota bacterium]
MKALATVSAAVLLLVSLPAQRSKPVNPGGLAVGVAEYPISFGIENPAELLGMMMAALAPRMLREDVASAVRIVDDEMEKELGFRLSKPATWTELGIHPTGSLRMSVLGFGTWGFPDPALFSLDTRDQEKLLAYLARQIGAEWDQAEGKPLIHLDNGGRTAVGFLGGRMYLYGASRGDDSADALRGILGGVGRERSISLDPSFSMVKAEAKGALPLALFFNLSALEEMVGEPGLQLPQSALLALGPQGLLAGASMGEDSQILKIESGAECRGFVAKFEKPAFALSISMADPLESMRRVVAEFLPKEVPDFDEVVDRLIQRLELDGQTLRKQIKKGSAGFLLYPGPRPGGTPGILAFFAMEKAASIHAEMRAKLPQNRYGFDLMSEGEDHLLYIAPDGRDEIVIGTMDDYLVIANCPTEVKVALAGEASTWEPKIGGKQIMACEVFPGDLGEMIGFSLLRSFNPFVDRLHLYGEVEIRENGLLGRVRPTGNRPAGEMLGD